MLPTELYQAIFSHLSRKRDLHSVILTCRLFRNVALPLLYHEIGFSAYQAVSKLILRPQPSGIEYAFLVKHAVISNCNTLVDLFRVLARMTALESLKLRLWGIANAFLVVQEFLRVRQLELIVDQDGDQIDQFADATVPNILEDLFIVILDAKPSQFLSRNTRLP